MTKRKKEKENKIEISCLLFSTMRKINITLRVYFALQYLSVFFYKNFASLCCGYLGAVPIPYVQDTILNLLKPYLRSATILLDPAVDIKHIANIEK